MAGLFGKGHSNPLGQGGVSDPFFIPLPPPLEQDGTTEEAPDAPPDSGGGPNTGDSNNNSGAPNENTSAPPVSQGFNEQLQREANRFETQRIHFLGLLAEKKAWV